MIEKHYFVPIIDNGMGLSRTRWAASMIAGFHRRKITLATISYPYPDGAMNIVSQDFLESSCDEMIIIDTDIVFTISHLDMLLSHDEPLVFGAYPLKQPGLTFPIMSIDDVNPFAKEGPLVEVLRAARGFMRASRAVFEQMRGSGHVAQYECVQTRRQTWEFWKTLQGGNSEDFYFCDLWRKLGGRVLIDKRIICSHEGSAVYPIKGTYEHQTS